MLFISALQPWAIGLIVAAVAVVIIVAIVAWYISTKNKLVGVRNDMEEAYSAMDVHMKKRYDLIPNLVETCKGYAKFESETLTGITQARSFAISASPKDKAAAESALTSSLHTLLNAVRENYPELKANAQFNNLSAQLEQLEEEIARSRKYYNAKIKIMNNMIEKFPSSFVAARMHLERVPYFEIAEAERVAPKVSF